MPAASEDIYAIIRLVRPFYRHLVKAVEDGLAGSSVTIPMRAVLERLHDDGPQTVPQIARAVIGPRQFFQRVVDDLIRQGLAERAPNRAHKRSWLIRLTPAGCAQIEAIKAREGEVMARIGQALDPADVALCHRVLAHLTESFGALADSGGRSETKGT